MTIWQRSTVSNTSSGPSASRRWFSRGSDRPVATKRLKRVAPNDIDAEQPVGATYRVASYTVYPSGFDQVDGAAKERWSLSVVDCGNGWAIQRGDMCLNISLQWEAERAAEVCDSQFLRRCRYNEHAAILRARRIVDRLEVAGLTFDEYANTVWADEE